MNLFFAAFLAGFLTVLAPCVFTLLPVVLGGSVTEKSFVRPMVIISSLGVSVFLFFSRKPTIIPKSFFV